MGVELGGFVYWINFGAFLIKTPSYDIDIHLN